MKNRLFLLFIATISLIACSETNEKNEKRTEVINSSEQKTDTTYSEPTKPVTVENYARAESDFQLVSYNTNLKTFGKLVHQREFYSVDNQLTVRVNRDTYYSFGQFDLTSPVTIVVPESGDRFLSLMLIDQDHSILPTIYKAGTYEFTQEDIGTRYLQVVFRTFVDANDPEDVKNINYKMKLKLNKKI